MYSITLLRSLVDSLIKQTQNSRKAITSSGLNDVALRFEDMSEKVVNHRNILYKKYTRLTLTIKTIVLVKQCKSKFECINGALAYELE